MIEEMKIWAGHQAKSKKQCQLDIILLDEEDLLNGYADGAIDKLFSEDKLLKYWNITSKKLIQCKNCGLKYACNDCRSLEIRLGAKL